MVYCSDLLKGIVIETKAGPGFTGSFLYSDKYHGECDPNKEQVFEAVRVGTGNVLNDLSRIPIIGIAAGVSRMALAVFHILSHLFCALITFDKGYCFHAAKGCCEFLKGFIEAIPVAGRLFANHYVANGEWWIIKIYNPDHPDTLDRCAGNWTHLKQVRPTAYVMA